MCTITLLVTGTTTRFRREPLVTRSKREISGQRRNEYDLIPRPEN